VGGRAFGRSGGRRWTAVGRWAAVGVGGRRLAAVGRLGRWSGGRSGLILSGGRLVGRAVGGGWAGGQTRLAVVDGQSGRRSGLISILCPLIPHTHTHTLSAGLPVFSGPSSLLSHLALLTTITSLSLC